MSESLCKNATVTSLSVASHKVVPCQNDHSDADIREKTWLLVLLGVFKSLKHMDYTIMTCFGEDIPLNKYDQTHYLTICHPHCFKIGLC